MASPSTIRTALATTLRTIQGKSLTVYDRWPDNLQAPCIVLRPGDAEPEQTFGRGEFTRWPIDAYVFTSIAGGIKNGQDLIDPFLATSSTGGIFGAIAADRTLGGTVSNVFVKTIGGYDIFNIGENLAYEGAMVSLEVWSS